MTPLGSRATVTVVGGGVVGLCCAYYLSSAGLRVTVVERSRVGGGASRGNAGEICADLVTPLPEPGVIGPAMRTLHRLDAALHIHPRPSVDLARFLLGFARHSTRQHYAAGVTALADLATDTFALFDELEAVGVDAHANKNGFLYVFGSRDAAHRALRGVQALRAPVADSRVLGPRELTDIEACLSTAARAGFLVRDQWAIDPNLFVDGLAARLRAMGVEIVEGARVTSVAERGGGTRVHTSVGPFDADTAVIAAGIWSREICRRLGLDLNIFPGKGYSFSVPTDSPPGRLVHLSDAHVAVNPLAGRLRLAGTMEFDRDHDRFRAARIAAIVAAARPYLHGVDWDARTEEWVGPRPMTPDGLPAIGALPGHRNTFLAAGHNMLGVMLSPSTGRLVTDLVTGARHRVDATPFAPARIARRTPVPAR